MEIVESTPVLKELEKFIVTVGRHESVYPLTSATRFRFASPSQLEKKRKPGLPKYSGVVTGTMQEGKREDLPRGFKRATTPQKVSRVLTGFESVLLSWIVRSIVLQHHHAFPLSLEYDGVSILTKRSSAPYISDQVNKDINAFSKKFLGCEMPISCTTLPEIKP